MTFRTPIQYLILLLFLAFSSVQTVAQCLDIETILVDSCDSSGDEGFNEMTRFRTGGAPLNVATMTVNWPAQSWQGLAQNGLTASKVATLNAQIAALGGCGRLIEPIAGIIPANTEVILITSQNFSLTANAFGALIQDIYILFQDNTTITTGHFGNYNATSGIRTLTISFGACSDTVSYDRSLLVDANGLPGASNGATVNFTPAGVATYTNGGCVAPIDVFSVDAGSPIPACPGTTINLAGTALGQSTVLWSAPGGTFSNNSILNPTFTLPFSASGSIVLTLTVTNSCGNSINDTVTITVNPSITPDFSPTLSFCSGSTAPILNTTSPNGITGVWSPSVISNTVDATYTFTPNAGQCANSFAMIVTLTPSIAPDFLPTLNLCSGNVAPLLNTTSPNGIAGVWSPSVINNTVAGTYTFTPNTGQCASIFIMAVTITTSNIIPDFSPTLTLCSGNVAPVLNTTSPNGITGVWSPSVINNTVAGIYTFTPNTGQCASNFTMTVTITTSNIIPDFSPTLTLCSGNPAPVLNTTSPNGIIGVWSPAIISNTVGGTYIFTPNTGQCASSFTMVVTVSNASVVPDFAASLAVCSGTIAPVLNATSPNGINGTWSPAIINTTVGSSYVFTPNSGQCATIFTSTVIITSPNIVPNFNPISPICVGDTLLALPTTSTNGITGSWSPALDNTQTKIYTFTPDAGQCAVATQITITVNTPSLVATFLTSTVTICNGDALTALPTMSTNGINGSWSPVLNNTQTQTYTFLPNPGQCALGNTFIINVTQKTIPTFNPVNPVCPGGILNALPITSLNGITGTWSPAINNMQTQTYTFQPDPNQCATTANLTITIIQPILPVFNPIAPVCYGTAINPLPSISSNGITGTWSPAFDNTTSQLYTFIPNAPQCATTSDLTITVAPNPTFTNTAYICFDAAGQLVNPANIDSGLSSAEYSFVWIKDGDVNPLGNVSPSYQATQTGIYKVTATNLITNCTITLVTTVEASPEATAYAYVNEDFADVQQIIVNVNGGLGDFLYQLNYGPFQQSNIFTITKGGDYTIHVKDLSGCNTFELQVTAFNFPKFFTPNDDGYNDTWNVDGLQAGQQGLITIFDRYGKLLKQITAHGEGWNGTFNGNRLPSTDYWFVISYRSISGESRTFRSHFSLKR